MKLSEDISIGLTLDGKDFTVQVRNANSILRELRQSLVTTANNTTKLQKNFDGIGSSFRHFMIMASTARFALLDFHDVFLRLPASIVKTSGEIERMTKLMEGLSTATDKVADAKSNRNFVFDLAKNAPFDVKTLTDSFVKLKAGGLDPTNGSMKALVDSVARYGGTSQQLERASVAIQQMSGKGVVSMEELRQQLGEAVPNAIQMMAIGVGKSMADLTDSISKGEVEAKSALERMFAVIAYENGGAAAKMMNTWEGMFEQLKTKWELFKYELAGGDSQEGAFADAKNTLQELIDTFDAGKAKKFGIDLADAVSFFATSLKGAVDFATKFYDEIKLAGEMALAAFAATKIIGTFSAVFSGISKLSDAYKASSVAFAAASKEKLIIKQNEVASMVAMMNAELAAVAKNQAAQQALFGMTGQRIYQENTKALAARAAQIEANIVAEKALMAQITTTGQAAVVTAGRMGGLMTAFNMLGGPVMVLTGIIMAAVWWWDKYANAAENAAKRARNAWQGIEDAKALQQTKDDIEKLRGEITKDEKLEKVGASKTRLLTGDGDYSQSLEGKRARLQELLKVQAKYEENARKAAVDTAVQRENALMDTEVRGYTLAWKLAGDKEKAALDQKNAEKLATLEKGTKKYAEAQKAIAKEESERVRKYATLTRDSELAAINSGLSRLNKDLTAAVKVEGENSEKAEALRASIVSFEKKKEDIEKSIDPNKIGTPNDPAKPPKDNGTGPVVGTLTKKVDQAKRDLEIAKSRFRGLLGDIDGVEEIEREVRAKYETMLKDGELKVLEKDPKTGKNKQIPVNEQSITANKSLKDAYEQMIQNESQAKIYEHSLALLRRTIDGLAVEEEQYNQLRAESADSVQFVNTKIRDLNSEYEKNLRLIKLLKKEDQELIEQQKNKRLEIAALTSAKKYEDQAGLDLEQAKIDGTVNTQEKIRLEYERTTRILKAEYRERKEDIEKNVRDEKKKSEELAALENAYVDKAEAARLRMLNSSKTPIERLREEWSLSTDAMNNASARWANSFMDHLTEVTTTGKTDWRKMVTSMYSDLQRIMLQKSLGKLVTDAFGGLGDFIKKSMEGDGGGIMNMFSGLVDSATKAAKSLFGLDESTTKAAASTAESILGTVSKKTAEQTATASLVALAQAANAATTALGGTAASGGMSGGGGLLGSLGGMFGGLFGESGASAMPAADTAEFATYFTSLFANGGIMSSDGPLSMKKYANGGIANTAQVAVFGEGDMNEAFVPLPDGRSIPVTMNSQSAAKVGSGNVQINITVNNNGATTQDSQSSSGGNASDYNNLATRLKAVVKQELVEQQRPGGVLYRS